VYVLNGICFSKIVSLYFSVPKITVCVTGAKQLEILKLF
jgi:hypothetical protein